MKAHLVSVIMPVYNGEAFIAHSIRSVLAQTYPNWELIVVDDGSSDGTAGIVARFDDPRIRYTHQENQGLAAARNAGIRQARGEFLAFLDADDLWQSPFLETCAEYLDANDDVAAVYAASRFVDLRGHVLPQKSDELYSGAELHRRLLEGGCFPLNAILTRTEAVRAVGMFDTTLQGQGTEDWDLWLRITERYSMHGLAEPLAHYRVYPGSMATDTAGMHDCRMSVLAKRFGPPDRRPASWTEEKRRAYGFAYRATALGYIQQGELEAGWVYLAQAVRIYPLLLERLDTFYELACGDQPRGYRGWAETLDIAPNAAELLRRLDTLFAQASHPVSILRGPAYGRAYLALAMLSDQAGQWRRARGYHLRAVGYHPSLLRDVAVARRLLKLCAGQRLTDWLRRLRSSVLHRHPVTGS